MLWTNTQTRMTHKTRITVVTLKFITCQMMTKSCARRSRMYWMAEQQLLVKAVDECRENQITDGTKVACLTLAWCVPHARHSAVRRLAVHLGVPDVAQNITCYFYCFTFSW